MPHVENEIVQKAFTPNPRNNSAIFKIFDNVQYNVVQHKKYAKEMIKLYRKLDENIFRESFKNALHYLFTFGDTSTNVDRVIQFVATFCTSLDDEEEFLMFIFNIIFECQCVSGQSVRYRASQLLAAVLAALGDDASLDDDLCDKLLTSQLQRLQDTRSAVRCRAAMALQRLQNPMESDDEVTRAYLFHMSCDPSSSVRRAILMSIAKSVRNVPFVLERLCDVDDAVRRAAFLYISAIDVKLLRVKQRLHTLKVGLTERNPRVRRVVEEILIPGWLSSFEGNIVYLLKAIRLDNINDAKDSQYVAGKLLESLFKRLPISELLEWLPTDKNLRLIPAEKLNKETAWYWRHLAEHLQKINDDETLEMVIPDLVVLIGYIRAILESPCPSATEDQVGFSTRQYVLHELACMLKVYDTTDPMGRTALQTLITDALTGDYGYLDCVVIRAFVSALELVISDITLRLEVIYSAISSLRDPEAEVSLVSLPVDSDEIKLKRARLRVSLNVATDAQDEAVREQNYELAAECKAKVSEIQQKLQELDTQSAPPPTMPTIRERRSDSETLEKCLIIINSALDTPQLKTVTPILNTIFEELKSDILENEDITEHALETVALYGMLDKEYVNNYKAFFFRNLVLLSEETRVATALRCVVDLLCVHGAKVFEDGMPDPKVTKKRKTQHTLDDDDDTVNESEISLSSSHSTTIELLLKLMENPCPSYRLIIVEGICRLLYLGHLESPAILSRLMLLWFNPATVEEDMLRQIIGVFFQAFPVGVDGAQEQIQKATLPTLRALANAPASSPIAEIDQEAVVRFIVSLTRLNSELIDSQGAMAMVLCGHLVRHPSAPEAGLACRMLALLSPPRETQVAIDLATMLRELCTKLPDKQSCRNLTRYLGALEAIERASISKMSSIGMADNARPSEDSLGVFGRATTSLPQPLARSTHVVINETVEEEVEIDESSPTEPSKIPEDPETEVNKDNEVVSSDPNSVPVSQDQRSDSDSDVSPVKKPKMTKGKKKKLPVTKETTPPEEEPTQSKNKENSKEKKKKGYKRSRSERSVVDVDRANEKTVEKKESQEKQKSPLSSSPFSDLDASNVTVRKSTQVTQSSTSSDTDKSQKKDKKKNTQKKKKEVVAPRRSTRSSMGSRNSAGSPQFMHDSSDDTQLHTIIYDNEIQQEVLNVSEDDTSRRASKSNVTVPETPENSQSSESDPEPVPAKGKGKKGKNK
ncbi:condensin complex subunit 3 isoform X1 [Pieris napi]|uniref:condensin complex subunit 3 isoform X1 n=1 Tax=Pieris napi TaxID=78633 RepID=UPI001FBA2F3A|nr:condensin complex subunit 3 isoform X1 [Pieris napi]